MTNDQQQPSTTTPASASETPGQQLSDADIAWYRENHRPERVKAFDGTPYDECSYCEESNWPCSIVSMVDEIVALRVDLAAERAANERLLGMIEIRKFDDGTWVVSIPSRHWHEVDAMALAAASSPAPTEPAPVESTFVPCGTARKDGYDPDQQLGRRISMWLDDLVLDGGLAASERRRLRFEIAEPAPDEGEPDILCVLCGYEATPEDSVRGDGIGVYVHKVCVLILNEHESPAAAPQPGSEGEA